MKTKHFLPKLIPIQALLISPITTYAATIPIIIGTIEQTLYDIIWLLFTVATVVFLWGGVQFIASAGDETKRKKAKVLLTWGIVGLAVMTAAWGVTTILVTYFDIPNTRPQFKPPPIFKPI